MMQISECTKRVMEQLKIIPYQDRSFEIQGFFKLHSFQIRVMSNYVRVDFGLLTPFIA